MNKKKHFALFKYWCASFFNFGLASIEFYFSNYLIKNNKFIFLINEKKKYTKPSIHFTTISFMILILFSNIIGKHTETTEKSNMMIVRIIKQKQLNLKLQKKKILSFLIRILLQHLPNFKKKKVRSYFWHEFLSFWNALTVMISLKLC